MAADKSEIGRDILHRVRWLYAILLVTSIVIIGRIVWIQYGPEGDELREKAEEITFERRSIPAERGDILARDGRILSTTVPEYEVRMDFGVLTMADTTFYKAADSLALCLSSFFGDRTKEQYETLLTENFRNKEKNRYVRILPRRLNYSEQKIVSGFPILREGQFKGGYIAHNRSRRFMPMRPLARSIIGTMNDTVPRGGVEMTYDDKLKGTPGSSLMQKISGVFWVPVSDPMNCEPVNGMDVMTTIDVSIQDVAESTLRRQLESCNAYWGTVILMEVETGEIHAMANLSRQGDGSYLDDYNHAIRSPVEPGSTFKLATLLMLLEDGGMKITDMVDCRSNGQLRALIGGRWVRDDHRGNLQTLKKTFEESSNIGFARSAYDIYQDTPSRFVEFITDELCFGEKTGIDIPYERTPDIVHPSDKKRWHGHRIQMMSYGYALEVSMMQTLALYNAVANNGRMIRPRIVKEVTSYGDTVMVFAPEAISEAIASPATIRAARQCLEGVVDEGTGRLMQSAPYRAAAKTGTAMQPLARGGYYWPDGSIDILASFVGYFPADKPKYSCIVAIKARERGRKLYGASLAGPVFRAIADRVYAQAVELHPKDYGTQRIVPAAGDVKGGRADQVAVTVAGLSLPYAVPGGGEGAAARWWTPVVRPEPPAVADSVPADTSSIAGGSSAQEAAVEIDLTQVPHVAGMGLKDALYLLESKGLRVSFSGRGKVISQQPAADEKVPCGSVITLKLEI